MESERPEEQRRRGGVRWTMHLGLAALCLALVFVAHATLITVPPGEAEMERFLPAAHSGAVLQSPAPVLTGYLAGVWKLMGARIEATRSAMLLVSALALYLTFLVAVELFGSLPGLPAVYAMLLLLASPLFYIQSLLAHPELPAMAALLAALLFFLRERHPWGAVAAAVLALSLPAGAWVALALGGWLVKEKRHRRALPYLAAGLVAAAFWLWNRQSGAHAGLSASVFHAGRLLYFLLIGNGHWIALASIVVAWQEGLLDRRRWRVALWAVLGFASIQLFLGRETPERGFLPVLPVFYAAATAGLFVMPPAKRWLGYGALACLLTAGHFVNPLLWPFPYENNLSFAEDARLRARTAEWLEAHSARDGIATAGPMAPALTDARWGYVRKPFRVLTLPRFDEEYMEETAEAGPDVFVLYSRDWDPPANLLRRREFAWAAARFLGIRTPLDPETLESRLGLKLATFLRVGRQWAEIYTREGPPPLEP